MPLEITRVHEGPMPAFPALALADANPAQGDPVRGFGTIGPVPTEWTTEGRIGKVVGQH